MTEHARGGYIRSESDTNVPAFLGGGDCYYLSSAAVRRYAPQLMASLLDRLNSSDEDEGA